MEEPMPKTLEEEIEEVLRDRGALDLFGIINAIQNRRINQKPLAWRLFCGPYAVISFAWLHSPGTGVYDHLKKMEAAGKVKMEYKKYSLGARYEYRLAA